MTTRTIGFVITFALLLVLPTPSALASQLARSAEELAQLESRIGELSKTLAAEAKREGSLTAELDQVEQRLSELKRSIRQQSAQEDALQSELAILEQESNRLAGVAADATERLGQLLRSGYMLGKQSGLRMLVNQQDPHKAARRMAMFRYVIAARNEQLAEIAALDQRIADNRNRLGENRLQLASAREALESDRQQLAQQQQERTEQVEQLRLSMAERSAEIGVYHERQKALERLMVELRRPPPKPKPESKPEPSPERTPKPAPVASGVTQPEQPAVVRSDATDTEQSAESVAGATVGQAEQAPDIAVVVRPGFANNRGALPKPLTAKISARFGDRREEGGLEWQGVLFGAQDGQAVRAVYPGQVVFSDWFRGFGQLMVVEHGDGYMSLYGHNQSLNARVGDAVSAGQVIASASDENAVPVAGLYFEIRHNGTPDDPLQWIR